MRRAGVLAGLLFGGGLTMAVAAWQTPPAAQALDVVKVKDGLYVLASSSPSDRATFSGGNVVVFVTEEGVVLVDTKLAAWGDTLLDRIRSVTDKPVTTIINTHTHGDHTGNNHRFGSVESVAHENTRANMARMDAFKEAGARFLPTRTFSDRLSLGAGRNRMDLYYFGPGHTNGDAFVVFPALGVMHTGDMFAWKDAPSIDRTNGGSGVALPQTLAKLLGAVKDVDTIIPGHMPVTGWADLQEFQRFTRDLLTAATAARAAGRTAVEAAASLGLSSRYPTYKSERVQAAVQAIYDELAAATP